MGELCGSPILRRRSLHVLFSSARVARVVHLFSRTWIMGRTRVMGRARVARVVHHFSRAWIMSCTRIMSRTRIFCTRSARIAGVFHTVRICDQNVGACGLSLRHN